MPSNWIDVGDGFLWCCGNLNKYITTRDIPDVVKDVLLNGDITVQGNAGSDAEIFAKENNIPFEKTTKGDCNNDGKLSVADAVLLQKWLLSMPDSTLTDWRTADLCEDGELNVFDLCMIKRLLISQK